MFFEIREHDLAGRIGKLRTKSGTVETPTLLPVVNPNIQPIPPKEMEDKFGVEVLITNAYILKKHFNEEVAEKGIHAFLNFDGVVMTDSGAYQILRYGDVEVAPEEIVKYQELIGTDIATILDVPTGWEIGRARAEYTVNETLRRAKLLFEIKSRDDILWVGPIQGGLHLNLLAEAAKRMSELPFQIYALGSPTVVMERYLFSQLVDMIVTAKSNLPSSKPLHLFGAGHPFMFALAVSLGCDLFDSAAYALYAREDRYMTDRGTVKLQNLRWLPCSCPICIDKDPKDLLELTAYERQRTLAEHNLYMSMLEVKRIKEAIYEGRLWEYLEFKSKSHPSLYAALKRLSNYRDFLEKASPTTKRRGLLFYSSLSLVRPEVTRHIKRLFERYTPPEDKKALILIPKLTSEPFIRSPLFESFMKELKAALNGEVRKIHLCLYGWPFGITPIELEETYPLSQFVAPESMDLETIKFTSEVVAKYIADKNYRAAVLLSPSEELGGKICEVFVKTCLSNGVEYQIVPFDGELNGKILRKCINLLRKVLKYQS